MRKLRNMLFINFQEKKEVKQGDFLNMLLNKNIYLTPKEFELFYFLYCNKNYYCSSNLILDKVWKYNLEINTSIVSTYLYYLRKKLKNTEFENTIILTRGYGYKFVEKPL